MLPAGVYGDDVAGAVACWSDGVADPPAVTRELVRRATELGVRVEEGVDARDLDCEVLVVCCGPHSAELAPELPVRPLCRQLLETARSSSTSTCRWSSKRKPVSTFAAAATGWSWQ